MKWLWIILGTLAVFTLFDAKTGWPHEWGEDEGRLKNSSQDVALCLWDNEEGNLCGKWTEPGFWCRGDAMFVGGAVFKVPNKSHWECTEMSCTPLDLESYFRFVGGSMKNGSHKYGWMELEEFKTLMWDWSIDLCN